MSWRTAELKKTQTRDKSSPAPESSGHVSAQNTFSNASGMMKCLDLIMNCHSHDLFLKNGCGSICGMAEMYHKAVDSILAMAEEGSAIYY